MHRLKEKGETLARELTGVSWSDIMKRFKPELEIFVKNMKKEKSLRRPVGSK